MYCFPGLCLFLKCAQPVHKLFMQPRFTTPQSFNIFKKASSLVLIYPGDFTFGTQYSDPSFRNTPFFSSFFYSYKDKPSPPI